MVEYLPRSAWTDVPKPSGLVRLDPSEVVGDAQHWPGGSVDFGGKTREQIARYLEGIRRYHTMSKANGGKEWTDIAYQQAIDPVGCVWELRGIEHRSAANGDTIPNARYGATLWLVGPNEKPTDAQITAYQTARHDRWLRRYPKAVQVKRHNDVRPEATACPGPYVGALVTSGTLTHPPEDDMATKEEIAEQVLRIERTGGGEDGPTLGVAVEQIKAVADQNRASLAALRADLADIEAKIAAAAEAVVALTPAQVSSIAAQVVPAVTVAVTDALAKQVADTLAARLKA